MSIVKVCIENFYFVLIISKLSTFVIKCLNDVFVNPRVIGVQMPCGLATCCNLHVNYDRYSRGSKLDYRCRMSRSQFNGNQEISQAYPF